MRDWAPMVPLLSESSVFLSLTPSVHQGGLFETLLVWPVVHFPSGGVDVSSRLPRAESATQGCLLSLTLASLPCSGTHYQGKGYTGGAV